MGHLKLAFVRETTRHVADEAKVMRKLVILFCLSVLTGGAAKNSCSFFGKAVFGRVPKLNRIHGVCRSHIVALMVVIIYTDKAAVANRFGLGRRCWGKITV